MVVRVVAALWLIAVLSSVVTVGRALLQRPSADQAGVAANALVAATGRLGKIERYASLVLMVAVVAAFFGGELNTDLWPISTAAWVALLAQSMFLRPYLTNFASLIERGFERPLNRILGPYLALDAVMAVVLASLVAQGVNS